MYSVDHEICIERGKVLMSNEEDPHYTQIFEKPEEIDEFIAKLLKAKKECWGKEKGVKK